MTDEIDKKPIARIYCLDETGKEVAVGMGFLISDRHVLTCAHVIESALGQKDSHLEAAPRNTIQLDFPFADSDGGLSRSGTVIYWCSVHASAREADIAVLRLDEPVPQSVQPAKLFCVSESNWQAFGIPKDDGYWSAGTFRPLNERGWRQLNVTSEDAKVVEGFSGTPVWCGRRFVIVGMVVARMGGMGYQPAFMLPVELLKSGIRTADADILFDYLAPHYSELSASIKMAYEQCLPDGWVGSNPEDLKHLLMILAQDVGESAGLNGESYTALVQFAAILLDSSLSLPSVRARLETWLALKVEDVSALLSFVKALRATDADDAKLASLLFQVNLSQNDDLKKYRVKAWLVPNPSNYNAKQSQGYKQLDICEDAEQTFTRNEIPGLVQSCLEQAVDKYRISDPTLEIFLPLNWLNEAVEDWALTDDDDDDLLGTGLEKIGWSYRVVLRSSDRAGWPYKKGKIVLKMQNWQDKWQHAEEKLQASYRTCDVLLEGCDPKDKRPLTQRLAPLSIFGIHFSQAPCVDRGGEIATTLGMSVPVAVWLREPIPGAQQMFDSFLEGHLNELLENVKQRRCDDCTPETDLGCHLAVLWDNPKILPPYER